MPDINADDMNSREYAGWSVDIAENLNENETKFIFRCLALIYLINRPTSFAKGSISC